MTALIDWNSPIPGVRDSGCHGGGVLFLGTLPNWSLINGIKKFPFPVHRLIQHRKGVIFTGFIFGVDEKGMGTIYPLGDPFDWDCISSFQGDDICMSDLALFDPAPRAINGTIINEASPLGRKLIASYDAARKARFE